MSDGILFTNARLFRGVDDEVIDGGAVWVEGRMIRYAGHGSGLKPVPDGVRRVDLGGQFVMPGMCESHAHISYTNSGPDALDKEPVERAMIGTIDNARVMLGSGFTCAISFGSVHRIDAYLRDSINNGMLVGPRLRACGKDLGATASNADLHPDYWRPDTGLLGALADGPWAIRKAVRTMRKNGADIIKLFVDGEGLSNYAPPGELTYTDEEVDAAISEAHMRNMRVATHSRGAAAVKQAVKFGADLIGHANYLDDEAIDMLRARRDRVFVGPAIAWEMAFLEHHQRMGFSTDDFNRRGYQREIDATKATVRKLKKAGVRVLIGGDYGLDITPHGTYAKDLHYFVELFGYSPAEALLAATRDGGAAFDPGGMIGTLEPGKYADLVIVDGDPLTDVRVLQDHARITAVMKDGVLYRGLMRRNPWIAET
jgi:imidazolonepropionase-like amidohydrolase